MHCSPSAIYTHRWFAKISSSWNKGDKYMPEENIKVASSIKRVVFVSILLLFFTIPHTLEDFATGEPGKAGVPAPVLSLVVSIIFGLQAVGLYWLGEKRRKGLWFHLLVGIFWPVASGIAQVPTILTETPYRSGFISVAYVVGIIVLGIILIFLTVRALKKENREG
jgi:hypothetical protein